VRPNIAGVVGRRRGMVFLRRRIGYRRLCWCKMNGGGGDTQRGRKNARERACYAREAAKKTREERAGSGGGGTAVTRGGGASPTGRLAFPALETAVAIKAKLWRFSLCG
jgi:hypothetical protein